MKRLFARFVTVCAALFGALSGVLLTLLISSMVIGKPSLDSSARLSLSFLTLVLSLLFLTISFLRVELSRGV